MTEMMQRYYSTARVGERLEDEVDVDQDTFTVAGEKTDSESNETSEDQRSTDSDSSSDSSEVEDDGSGDDSVAHSTPAPSNHTKEAIPSSLSATPQHASLQGLEHLKPVMSQLSHISADAGKEEYQVPNPATVYASKEQPNADPVVRNPGQGLRKRIQKKRKKSRARRTKMLAELQARQAEDNAVISDVPRPVTVDIVATSRSSVIPSPPGLPRVSLPTTTSISHAGTQRRKRKVSGQDHSVYIDIGPTKKRR
ncbi:uncharacterized protein N0V89_004327 [Didymosphaeria variabile]|uniref:Uncharacterized protein n=1 Tax=Didymosphaeria variabile TaxID=1932322 RepID=A0A9W8XQY8_9PLEO|nr:uncharacterized protein N0V89_004327 [Didymosphaeria variabile]KAJ4356296.1 hypothetical protein N0V89_004327 [Didymosphaeria variabile]